MTDLEEMSIDDLLNKTQKDQNESLPYKTVDNYNTDDEDDIQDDEDEDDIQEDDDEDEDMDEYDENGPIIKEKESTTLNNTFPSFISSLTGMQGGTSGAGTSGVGTSGAGTSMQGGAGTSMQGGIDDDEEENESEEEADYLQKFDKDLRENFIEKYHPESKNHNFEEVKNLARVVRDDAGVINDSLHKTLPFLTKYEMTRILGQRAKQLNSGAASFVKIPPNIIEGYEIAKMELEEKKIPFIIKRPLPDGTCEYWNVADLEIL